MQTLDELINDLSPDAWRQATPFSSDIVTVHDAIFTGHASEPEIRSAIQPWLGRYQPCLFGRIAAKLDLLSFCTVTESDIALGESHVTDKIQAARSQWTRLAFEGRKSGFILHLVSPAIASAVPDHYLLAVARRLCELYLLRDITADEIYLDEVFLEKPGPLRIAWKWHAGVNFFGSQGDGRWWTDHRFPGGVAFSVNSVGHLVKSGIIARAMKDLDTELIDIGDEWLSSPVDSLGKALDLAMRTIHGSAQTPFGKATRLVDVDEHPPIHPCPIGLPDFLNRKNHCEYRGYYHTDITIPSEYFHPTVARPASLSERPLDLTYLFLDRLANPDFHTMGKGRRIRARAPHSLESPAVVTQDRSQKMTPEEIGIGEHGRLSRALGLE